MTIHLTPRARGLMGVSANAIDGNALITELQTTFASFMEANDKRLDDLEKGREDYVQNEKVERINSSIDELMVTVNEQTKLIAALRVGPGGGSEPNPDVRAHADAFNGWFRRGKGAENVADLEVKAALSTDSDPDGGFVVPEEMATEIDRVLTTVSAMRGLAQVITISTGEYKQVVQTGGLTASWVGEREARPETGTPPLVELNFPAMELYAEPPATQTMLDDARIDVGAWLGNEVSIAFADAEGLAFVSGTGVNQPRGMLSYTTVADASWTWGNIGFTVTGVAADINDATNDGVTSMITCLYTLKKGYRANATWLMNRTLVGKVRNLKSIGDDAQYLWQPPVQLGEPAMILGYPVEDDDNMPDVGANAFPIAFGDFRRAYLVVDRFGIRVLRDPYTNKPYVRFYTTKRVGGGMQNFEAIKLLKCSA